MPKGSEELTQARKDEIISACAELYETMNFKDVTLKDIGAKTSFTRTLIYYYFHTKEEIFLALLQREYEAWIEDLHEIRMSCRRMTVSQFADALARSLERRITMIWRQTAGWKISWPSRSPMETPSGRSPAAWSSFSRR